VRRTATITIATAGLFAASLLSSCSEPESEPNQRPGLSEGTSDLADACVADLVACARDSSVGEWIPDEIEPPTGEPIVLGMVNQENTAAGSYPELSQAVQAAVTFVNEDLGGIGGRPIEVEVCNTEFSTEGSTTCGQRFVEAEVPAVLGGIDVFGNAVETLNENGIPYIGGIPISTPSVTSPNSFQWSGGTWGATVAFAEHAAKEIKAERVSIVYGEFGSITQSAEYGKAVLEDYGIDVQLVPYPILATDISSALNAAATTDPDALVLLAADSGCKAGFDGIDALDLDATIYFVGACASPAIIDEVGPEKTNGAIFNVEGPIGQDQPSEDFTLYSSVIEAYGDGLDPVGAGTVSFRAFMNLYMIMQQLDGDITPATITEKLASQVDAPSFAGHPYTCDGKQFDGLPAMCSPQQILGQMTDGVLAQLGDWIDVGGIYAG